MTQQALGLIEAVGLPVAIEAADAALKAANVTLIGYEKTKGGGLIGVKLRGDVGAVKAAVEAGVASASRVGKIFSHHVIPRPHQNTELLVGQVDRGPVRPVRTGPAAPAPAPVQQPAPVYVPAAPTVEPEPAPVEEVGQQPAVAQQPEMAPQPEEAPQPEAAVGAEPVTCNLCNDPACRRQPGQLHRLCIHYKR